MEVGKSESEPGAPARPWSDAGLWIPLSLAIGRRPGLASPAFPLSAFASGDLGDHARAAGG